MAAIPEKALWLASITAIIIVVAGIAYISAQVSGINEKITQLNQTLQTVSGKQEATSQALEDVSQKLDETSGALQSLNQSLSSLQYNIEILNETISGLQGQLDEISQTVTSLTGFPRLVTDDLGRTIIIPYKPERIISLAPSITEMVYAIGAEGLLVGVDDYSNYPPSLLDAIDNGSIKRVGGFVNPNIELILSLQPDIVFTTTGVQEQIAYQLEQKGLTVIALGDQDVYQVIASIVKLGYALGMEEYAMQVASQVSSDLAFLASITANETERPKVAIIVWNNPIFVAGGESFLDDLIFVAGGENAFTNYSQGYPMIGPEELVEAAPDIIVFTEGSGVSNSSDAINWLLGIPGGDSIPAVVNGKVYVLHGEYSNSLVRPGVRTPAAGILLYAIIHSDTPNDVSEDAFNLIAYADQLAATYGGTFNLVLVRGIVG